MMLLVLLTYWVEAFLTAAIFIGGSVLLYVLGALIRQAWRAIHRD